MIRLFFRLLLGIIKLFIWFLILSLKIVFFFIYIPFVILKDITSNSGRTNSNGAMYLMMMDMMDDK